MPDSWFYNFCRSQFLVTIPEQTCSFRDEIVIITGSNTGLGFEAARQIAHLGAAKVILACRTVSKGEAAASRIATSLEEAAQAGSTNKPAIEVWELDTSSYKSIKAFVARAASLDRLDAVIQNAGVAPTDDFVRLDESGDEKTLTTNVTGALFFGLSILHKLRESAKKTSSRGRLSFVGSDTHYLADFSEINIEGSIYEAMNDSNIKNMKNRYAKTKLLLYLTVKEIAARSPISEDSNVIINVQTPGLCWSDFGRDASFTAKIFVRAFRTIFARSTEVGGRTLVHAANPDLGVEAHGKFLMDSSFPKQGTKSRIARTILEGNVRQAGVNPAGCHELPFAREGLINKRVEGEEGDKHSVQKGFG